MLNHSLGKDREFKLITLLGLSGSGKSTVGQHLAKSMRLKFIDTDKLIEESEKKSIQEIFQENGELYFRQQEESVLTKVCQDYEHRFSILAVGAGLPFFNKNQEKLIRSGYLVYLRTRIETLIKRLDTDAIAKRPLLSKGDGNSIYSILKKQLDERVSFYENVDVIIDTDDKSVSDLSFEIGRYYLSEAIWC